MAWTMEIGVQTDSHPAGGYPPDILIPHYRSTLEKEIGENRRIAG